MVMYIKLKQLYIYNRVKHLRWSFSAIFFAKKSSIVDVWQGSNYAFVKRK